MIMWVSSTMVGHRRLASPLQACGRMRLVGVVLLVSCTAEVAGTGALPRDPKSDSPSGGGDMTSMTLTKYFDEIAGIHCRQAFGCRDSFPAAERGYPFEAEWGASEPACEALLIADWNPTQVETEIAKGRITYDGAAAVSCLQGVAFAACPEYWRVGIDWAESCYYVVVGMVQTGGTCENDYSCVSFLCDPTTHACE